MGRRVNKILRSTGIAVTAFLSIGANANWNTEVERTDRGTIVGNPEVKTVLTEFLSYSCPACAMFTYQGEGALQLAFIGQGKLRFEIRPIIRNEADLVATMLVQCGDNARFSQNHTMFMLSQPDWLPKFTQGTPAQKAVWNNGDNAAGRRSIATALGFYPMIESRGYSRTEADRCLADEGQAERLRGNTDADFEEFGIPGTPSFAIDGEVLENVHSWQSLVPHIGKRF